MEFFDVFSNSKVLTLIQSPKLVYHFSNFEMYSLVIKIAILVNSAVLLPILIPALGFNTANVLGLIVESDPIKTSLI